jgi:diguanylate cyclase (GGDEF)-like protein
MMVAAARTMTRRLAAEALTDPLTGLGNRRAFDRALARETARTVRHDRPLAVAVIDVDGLKRVNDTLGHAAGDSMLVDLAAALRQAIRVEDAAYRLGGDEFALILADAVVLDVHALEDRIRRHGAPPFSLGLASTPPDHVESLVELADARLYEGRYQRRQRVP